MRSAYTLPALDCSCRLPTFAIAAPFGDNANMATESDKKSKSGVRVRKPVPEVPQLTVDDGIVISVTQAFCAKGHPLIEPSNPTFDDQPGVRLRVAQDGGEPQDVTLSPIHGHHARYGGDDFIPGVACSVRCPTCDEELPVHEAECRCREGQLRLLYLTERLVRGDVAMVCDVWGCHRSRVVDRFELLSEWMEENDE